MTFAIIGIRDEREFKMVSGPGPVAEVTDEFKQRVADDLGADSDGQVHGILELFELRQPDRRHKIRAEQAEAKGSRKSKAAEPEEDENSHGRGRRRAGHSE